ncbi:MAG: hypothetical protein AMJ79_01100 [Phycisphaerae bacterium SM23_30]|nr:MAG: hypothetical protein AMJ79_01100 [Phycisphaerae bacterium SM23_30]
MTNASKNNALICPTDSQLCCQAGYLPVPLRCVPAESLAGLEIYLSSKEGYSLYSAISLDFGPRDSQRLLDSGVDFVYVSVRDHQVYYRTIERTIDTLISDPNIKEEKKSEILYATTIELSNQLLAAPPGKDEVKRAASLVQATVQLIIKDKRAFGRLYEVFNHDFYTATHLVNVCGLTISLAQKMGLVDADILQRIGTGGLLHDIGKIFVPSEILNSPEKLTPEEFEIIKTHVDRGRQHLETVMDLPPEMLAVVAEHHERMDGSGYPKGLKHDQISPLGRLSGIVDSFDAMTSVRPYRSSTFTIEDALQQIEDETPLKFDVEIVHAFAMLIENAVQVNYDEDTKNSRPSAGFQLGSIDPTRPKHTQYYFRMPVVVRRVKKIRDKLNLGSEEKVIFHKISCVGLGFLSPLPFDLDQNILISALKLEAIGLNKLLAVVTRCRNHDDGWYTVDAQFHQAQSQDLISKIKEVAVVREISPLLKRR